MLFYQKNFNNEEYVMKKYLIVLLIFIGCIQSLCADDDKGLFDYVASRDEVAVLSMIKEDFNAFTQQGLQLDNNGKVYDKYGVECAIKVMQQNNCTIGAIFYVLDYKDLSVWWEINFLVVDELHQDKDYGSFMIKSLFNQMNALTGGGICMFCPLINVSICRAFDEKCTVCYLLGLPPLDESFFDRLQCIDYSNLEIDFVQACTDLDIETVKNGIAQGINVNHLFMFKYIPDHGLVLVEDLQLPLCFAIENNSCELAEVFINAGSTTIGIFDSSTPLIEALKQHNIEMVSLLIQAGCDPNELSCGRTPLMFAMKEGDKDIILLLLEAGADATLEDLDDESLLYIAISDIEDREVVKALIDAGANVHGILPWEESLLQCAIFSYDPEVVLILVQAGCDLNYQDAYGDTALHYAVENICDGVIFQALLAAGADHTMINFDGETPLDAVAKMIDEKESEVLSSDELREEIAQLEKIKMILLQHQNKQK